MHDSPPQFDAQQLLTRLIPALVKAGSIEPETLLTLAKSIDVEAREAGFAKGDELNDLAELLRGFAGAAYPVAG